jgi:hypothetical protein
MNLRFSHPQTCTIWRAQRTRHPAGRQDRGCGKGRWRCRQCGSNKELHFDHVIPWSKGGPNTVGNIQLLCGTCNRRKGADDIPANLPPSPYRQPWHSPAADTRPSQPPGIYKSPPPLLPYMSEREREPTCPVCGMLSALHTGALCRRAPIGPGLRPGPGRQARWTHGSGGGWPPAVLAARS